MKSTRSDRCVIFCSACVLLFIFVIAICNVKLSLEPIKGLVTQSISFSEFTNKIQTNYVSDDLITKSRFINLNGAYARIIGKRAHNEVALTKNGMLVQIMDEIDTAPVSASLNEFSNSLSENLNIPFLFIQAPNKMSLDGAMQPDNMHSYANETADKVLAELSANNTNTLDLRPYFSATAEMSKANFYNTDHHWTYDAAFSAFGIITEHLAEMFPDRNIDTTYTNEKYWDKHTLEDYFLGYRGKRVGVCFGGVDDFSWYTSAFDMNLSCAIPEDNKVYKGRISNEIFATYHIEKKDYFNKNPYSLYRGGVSPLVQYRNSLASSDLKILMLRDSFALPVQTFMTSVFREIDAIDMRYFTECSVAEYVERTKPDLVIMLIYTNSLYNKDYCKFGIEYLSDERSLEQGISVFNMPSVQIDSVDKNYGYYSIKVEPAKVYRLTFDNVTIDAGNLEGVTVALYSKEKNRHIFRRVFDVDYRNRNGQFEWIFETPDTSETLQLLLYAGLSGSTKDNIVTYSSVNLEECC